MKDYLSGTMCFVNWIEIWLQWIYKELAARGGRSLFWEKIYKFSVSNNCFCMYLDYLPICQKCSDATTLFILISSKKRLAGLKPDTQIFKLIIIIGQ